jgi:ketosteroid isomerase-like protein
MTQYKFSAKTEELKGDFMKKRYWVVAWVMVLSICADSQGQEKKTVESKTAKEIRAILDKQVEAWNRKDLEAFMSAYWKSEALTFYSGGIKTNSWQTTIDRYRNRYQSDGKEMGQLEFSELQIETLSNHSAFVRGHWQLKMKDGEPGGLFTLIFRRLPSGWKIIHDHTSSK